MIMMIKCLPKKGSIIFWGWCSHAIISHWQGITDHTEIMVFPLKQVKCVIFNRVPQQWTAGAEIFTPHGKPLHNSCCTTPDSVKICPSKEGFSKTEWDSRILNFRKALFLYMQHKLEAPKQISTNYWLWLFDFRSCCSRWGDFGRTALLWSSSSPD